MNVPRETIELIESTAVSNGEGSQRALLHRSSLQNPTERPRNSPFFGSVLSAFLAMPAQAAIVMLIHADYRSTLAKHDYRYCNFVDNITKAIKCKRLRSRSIAHFGESQFPITRRSAHGNLALVAPPH
jgi:hypothetical protein